MYLSCHNALKRFFFLTGYPYFWVDSGKCRSMTCQRTVVSWRAWTANHAIHPLDHNTSMKYVFMILCENVNWKYILELVNWLKIDFIVYHMIIFGDLVLKCGIWHGTCSIHLHVVVQLHYHYQIYYEFFFLSLDTNIAFSFYRVLAIFRMQVACFICCYVYKPLASYGVIVMNQQNCWTGVSPFMWSNKGFHMWEVTWIIIFT